MLNCPMDIQQREWDADEPYQPSTTLFTKGVVQPDPQALEEAVKIIRASRKPVIVVGRGARWAGADDAVLKLGERIGALIAATLLAKTWLSDRTEYHAGMSGNFSSRYVMKLLHEADCVIGVGASLNRHTTGEGYLYPDAQFIQIDTKP